MGQVRGNGKTAGEGRARHDEAGQEDDRNSKQRDAGQEPEHCAHGRVEHLAEAEQAPFAPFTLQLSEVEGVVHPIEGARSPARLGRGEDDRNDLLKRCDGVARKRILELIRGDLATLHERHELGRALMREFLVGFIEPEGVAVQAGDLSLIVALVAVAQFVELHQPPERREHTRVTHDERDEVL